MNAITSFSGDYRWLSNFHKVQIEAFGYTFGSVEAAYQAAKEIFSLNREEVVLQFTQDTAGSVTIKEIVKFTWQASVLRTQINSAVSTMAALAAKLTKGTQQ